ncbi:phage tail tape measure protein [uncultured Desulfovibrio sp.]|uniref:phage tail tape measure protein n=1 Tax=uncultured Desulfovibrio sp. TaxID=167968 RepID=UPI0020516290|nr:phage tail tape measure protein [uncultured Desulfovibrio sp.]DAQ05250.1 MAG TPA: minor tail protein [Caudoviricetes sp.]
MSLKTSLVIDLAGNIQTRARQYGSALGGLANRGRAAMRGLSGAAQLAGRGLDKLGNRYTALLGGGAAVMAVRGTMSLQEQLTRLGITADASDEIIKGLHNSILDTANAPDIRVDPSQILAAVDSVMEKTGDLKFAQENIRNIGLAIQASGADGAAIGDIFAEFQKQGMSAKDALASVDVLVAQGKMGAFVLKDLASLGPRVVTSYTSLGRRGPQAMREMGAALQLIRMGTGSSEQAATAWEAMLRTFSDKKKVDFLQKQGIKLFDKKGNLRAANELMVEILKAAGNDAKNLSDVFDAEAIRAFNAILGELKRTGGVETLDKLMQIQGDGTTVQRDSARAAQTANAALQSLKTTWGKFADSNLAGPIQKMADALNAIEPGRLETALDRAGKLAVALGGAVAAYKLINAGMTVRGWFSGGKKAGGVGTAINGAVGGLSGGLAGIKLPLPVYVVNKQMSLTRDAMLGNDGGIIPDAGSTGKKGKGGKTRGGRAGRWGRFAGRAGGMASAAYAAYEGYQIISDDEASIGDKAGAIADAGGQALGGWAGGALGAKVGAAIGTAIVPGLGTAIGGALGGIVGGIAGSTLGQTITDTAKGWFSSAADWFTGKEKQPSADVMAQAALQMQQAAALLQQTAAKGIGVDVNVLGNATATIARGAGAVNLHSGVSHGKLLGG